MQDHLWLGKGILCLMGLISATVDFPVDYKAIQLLHIYRAHPEERELVSGNTFLPANFTSLIQPLELI